MKLRTPSNLILSLAVALVVLCGFQEAIAAQKPRFGGNLKVADELTRNLDSLRARSPMSQPVISDSDNLLIIDFAFLPEDLQSEVEGYFQNLSDPTNRCHWVLDYPYTKHDHHNVLFFENGRVQLRTIEPGILSSLQTSSCFTPEILSFAPFRPTQFGFEANLTCVTGRPFVDSITPIPVDPINPYLSFKLNDVDVFSIPEERFQQISPDQDLSVIPGPSHFIFLKTDGLQAGVLNALKSSINVEELVRSVLNHHAEILLDHETTQATAAGKIRVSLSIPEENPFHLIGERLKLQLSEAGFEVVSDHKIQGASLELKAIPVRDSEMDLTRYRIILEAYSLQTESSWFETWDELESSGRLIPLLLYQSSLAARKGIMNLKTHSGILDFSNAWISKSQ